MNTLIQTPEQEIRSQIVAQIEAAAAAARKIDDARRAVKDAELSAKRGPEKILQLEAMLASVVGQKPAIIEGVARRLSNRGIGSISRDEIFAELGKIVVAEIFSAPLLEAAKLWCVDKAQENLTRARADLAALEKSQKPK